MTIVVLLLVAWEAAGRLNLLNPLVITEPSRIALTFWNMLLTGDAARLPHFFTNLEITLFEATIAFVVSMAVGTTIGMSFGLWRAFGNAYEPLLLALYSFPFIVLLPLTYLFLGIGPASNIAIGSILGFFYVTFNTSAAIRQVDQELVKLSRSFGYGRLRTFFGTIMPSAAPTIVVGFRQGFGYAYVGVLVGEILLPNVGLGYLIEWSSLDFYVPELYALIALVILIGGMVDGALRILGGRMERWRNA